MWKDILPNEISRCLWTFTIVLGKILRRGEQGRMQPAVAVVKLFDYLISFNEVRADVEQARRLIADRHVVHYMVCANPHSLVMASRDDTFRAALQNADILVPDGVGIILAAKLLHLPIKARVSGSDFFYALNDSARRVWRTQVFFSRFT